MTLMSKGGRVLLIDDMLDEVYPMMRVLSKNGVKYAYFSGEKNELPNEKYYDTRIVFLDLYLIGENREINFELIKNTFKGIFDKTNGPIIIILWTTKTEDFPDFCKYYGENIKFPAVIDIVPLNKNDYFERDAEGFFVPKKEETQVYQELKDKILASIPNSHWFHVHTFWDNLSNEASIRSLNNFYTIFPDDKNINKKMWSLILSLAIANSGDNVDVREKNEVIKNALYTLNMVFQDELENIILHSNYEYPIPDMTKTEIVTDSVAAKIHNKIHIAYGNNTISPGSIIVHNNDELKNELLQIQLKKGSDTDNYLEIWNESKCIICEISPMCDCFSNKWRKHRIVYGILHPIKFENRFKSDGGYLCSTMPFEYKKESYQLKLDFRYLDAVPLDYFNDDTPIMRIRQDLLSEIQIKCSSHVNRTGIVKITPKEFNKFLDKFKKC